MSGRWPVNVSGHFPPWPMSVAFLEGDRFHVFKKGEAKLMLYCATHVVVRDRLAALLGALCPGQVSAAPARIEQVATGETWPGYSTLHPAQELPLENLDAVPTDGNRVWRFASAHLFVSPAVADALRREFPSGLEFSDGFSAFAG